MIHGQSLFTRAGKLKPSRGRGIRTAGALIVVAAALLPTFPADGKDASAAVRSLIQRPVDALPLPPIPYLETTPWLEWAPIRNGLKVDTLQLPAPPFGGASDDELCRHRTVGLPIS